MIRSLPRLLRNGTFRTAAAFALVFLLAAAVPEAFSLESPSFAQDDTPTVEDAAPDIRVKKIEPPSISENSLILSGLVLAFLAIALLMIRHTFKGHVCKKTGTIERITIVTILVMGSLFLITSGHSSSHIAPAFGLFGTIGGYLLGQIMPWKKQSRSEGKSKNELDDDQ